MIKYIVSDVDETLLDSEHQIPKNNVEMIRKAIDAGARFICATGRGFHSIDNVVNELNLLEDDDVTISFNGGAITRNKDKKILYFQGLTYEKVEEIFHFAKSYDVCIEVYSIETVYTYNLNEDERSRIEKQHIPYEEFDDITMFKTMPISKVLLQKPDIPYLKEVASAMGPVAQGLSIAFSSGRYCECNAENVSKGLTLSYLLETMGATLDEVCAVGDSSNDISMLKIVKLSVAAANATEEVKALCDVVTENDHNQGVLAEVIEKYILTEV